MRVINPITIDDTILTSSNVAENDYEQWNSGSTYGLGIRTIIIYDSSSPAAPVHKVYESLQAGNIGHNPVNDDQTAPVYWLLIGPTNKYKMFDLLRNTQTEQATPLQVTITPGQRINSIGLVGLENAESATISVTVDGVEVYTRTENLITRNTRSWSEFFFGGFDTKEAIALFDLPPFTNGVISISLSRASGNVKCGGVVIGNNVYLGQVKNEAESDALNFSKIDRDEFGDSLLTPRRTIPKINVTILSDKNIVNKLLKARVDLNAVPALWSGLDDNSDDGYFNAFLILGVYKRFLINAALPENAMTQLEIEEV